jgi:hypothetical protein
LTASDIEKAFTQYAKLGNNPDQGATFGFSLALALTEPSH